MIRQTLLIAFLMFSLCSFGQIKIPKEFVETVIPKQGSSAWYVLNQADDFEVLIINEKLAIQKKKNCVKGLKVTLTSPKGSLVGTDGGEWGGELTYVPTDTTQKPIEIKRGNIKFIFKFKGKIYFIEGLAHKSISEGALYELNRIDNEFIYKKIIDFEDAPEALAIFNDNIFIASHENFYVVKNLKKEIILSKMFWSGLYPNSIVVFDEKNIFIGIRSGIAKLDLTTKNVKFYKRK